MLEVGLVPIGYEMLYQPDQYYPIEADAYVRFDGEVTLGPLFAGGGITVPISGGDGVGSALIVWTPGSLNSMYVTGLRFGGLEVGFRGYCAHPVASYFEVTRSAMVGDYAYQELYIQFTASGGYD